MSLLRFDDLAPVPWKNGMGITREIAVVPAGASVDAFTWRASIADVDTASPFSSFPGVDRTIVLLDGDGFTMTLDGVRQHALTERFVPFAFAGEASVDVDLAGGATRDFNLMVRRGRASARVTTMDLTAPLTLPSDAVLAHLARGSASVDGHAMRTGDTWLGRGTVVPEPHGVLLVVTVVVP